MSGISGGSLKHYRLVVRLGYGRSTDVLLATREVTPLVTEPVVVKRLHERYSQDADFVRRFTTEASLLRRLDHPHVVKVLDAGVLEGRCCIVHEYLEGQPLRQLLRRAADTGGLPRELAVYVAICALKGLHHAHEATGPEGRRTSIVHGNVTPHGVFVTNDGGLKLTDFSIAGWYPVAGDASRSHPFYGAPEQDADGGVVDRRADVWSVGIVLWESLTGKNPFGDDQSPARVAPRAKRSIAAPSTVNAHIPAALDAIVARALAWDTGARYQTALDMQRDLERWLASVPCNDAPVQLGALMRRLFGNEVVEQRRLVTVLRGGDDPVPSSRSGEGLMASAAAPANGSAEAANGPPTSRSPQRPPSVPPPPQPLPPLAPPPISRPPAPNPTGSLPNLPPPPINKAAGAGAGKPKSAKARTSALTFRALELSSKGEEAEEEAAAPSEEAPRAPLARAFDYRAMIAIGVFCAGFSVLVTSLVVWNVRRRSAGSEATAIARKLREPVPAAAAPERPAAEPQHEEAPPVAQQTEAPPVAQQTEAPPVAQQTEAPPAVEHANVKRAAVARTSTGPAASPEPSHPRPAEVPAKAESAIAKAEPANVSPPAEPAETPASHPAATEVPAENGFLTVDTTPWSLVSENGKSLGQTPLVRVALAPGVHVLVLKNPELGIQTSYTVTIQPGKTLVKRIGIE